MSSPSETPEAEKPVVDEVDVDEQVKVVVDKPSGAIGRRGTSAAPSPAKVRAWTALIKALASNIVAVILALGLVIVLGIAVYKDSKDAYAPICALLGTLVGIWLKGKERPRNGE